MRFTIKNCLIGFLFLLITGCATVRQQDINAWAGMPVEALETHSFFITVPVYKTKTESGIEVWNYANGADVAQCFGNTSGNYGNRYMNANTFATCSNIRVVCNNIFYIRDGVILEYAPTGRCYTNSSLQPEARYRTLLKK